MQGNDSYNLSTDGGSTICKICHTAVRSNTTIRKIFGRKTMGWKQFSAQHVRGGHNSSSSGFVGFARPPTTNLPWKEYCCELSRKSASARIRITNSGAVLVVWNSIWHGEVGRIAQTPDKEGHKGQAQGGGAFNSQGEINSASLSWRSQVTAKKADWVGA